MDPSPRELIVKLMKEKVALKQTVAERTEEGFVLLKRMLRDLFSDLQGEVKRIGKNIPLEYKDRGDYRVDFTLGDDYLVFQLHTNVFTFEGSHEVWKTSYVRDDASRSFVGKILVYNFLTESMTYNRPNDLGYLIARIFINKENHYFVEGKRQLGFLYNDFSSLEFNEEAVRKLLESAILYSLDFDPFTPPYDQVIQVTVGEIQETEVQAKIATGKRLGFRFQTDSGAI
ncbi:MAG: hypothetical protein ACO1G7_04005 [Bacteroidota bacterium]|jgi:hypothetical protein|uniref:hypothetical protein n=1 Tax=Candidatus Pollutiaquabacter sp. TaxID=3416354 RepID=UPI001A527FCC|nr:hypothetical protein [Bacteroidota bacterium]MBL7948695.1 hypothetical protein [Bacteroidia bacterium]MBP6009654.1 hypothetical protein [Bacteroidia bacterium]MBP7270020.1 hypothetical protein [Bacteroidia bacterium]MBP7436669.1 hypothetical protein [Bacteroidia bacterium]